MMVVRPQSVEPRVTGGGGGSSERSSTASATRKWPGWKMVSRNVIVMVWPVWYAVMAPVSGAVPSLPHGPVFWGSPSPLCSRHDSGSSRKKCADDSLGTRAAAAAHPQRAASRAKSRVLVVLGLAMAFSIESWEAMIAEHRREPRTSRSVPQRDAATTIATASSRKGPPAKSPLMRMSEKPASSRSASTSCESR